MLFPRVSTSFFPLPRDLALPREEWPRWSRSSCRVDTEEVTSLMMELGL